MLYYFGYGMMWMTFRIFFRKIVVQGRERLQRSKPTIIISNHPASFLDAMVLAVFLGRPLHFYVRGDIFSHPLARWVLSQFHMIPIFSIDHGVANLEKNKHTFFRGQQLLRNGNVLLIFPEGFSRFSKELSPFKKGAARVAMQTAFEGEFDLELHIQVVSINYSFHGFRSGLHIRIGDSIQVEKYRSSYLQTPNHAITSLNKEMMNVFEKNVIHVKQGKRTSFVESLLRIDSTLSGDKDNYFSRSRKICECVSALSEDEYDENKKVLQEYISLLTIHGLSHDSFPHNPKVSFSRSVFLVLYIPLFIIVYPVWHIIHHLTKWIADRTVTREDFYTSVFCGVFGVLGFFWWITLVCLSISVENLAMIIMAGISPLLYMLSLHWLETMREVFSMIRLNQIRKNDVVVHHELIKKMREISCMQ